MFRSVGGRHSAPERPQPLRPPARGGAGWHASILDVFGPFPLHTKLKRSRPSERKLTAQERVARNTAYLLLWAQRNQGSWQTVGRDHQASLGTAGVISFALVIARFSLSVNALTLLLLQSSCCASRLSPARSLINSTHPLPQLGHRGAVPCFLHPSHPCPRWLLRCKL